MQQALLHPADKLGCLVGTVTQCASAGFASLPGLLEVGESLLIFAHRLLLLLQALMIDGLLDLAEHEADLAVEASEGFFQFADRRFVAIALVMLTRDAQFLGALADDRDIAQLVTTVDDAVHALPASEGDGQSQ
ncbi:hypothetical protein D3C78_667450 [compost metagenome]